MYNTKKSEFTDERIITVLENKDSSISYSVNLSALLVFGKVFAEKIVNQIQAFSKTRAVPPVSYAHQVAKWGLCISQLKINIGDYDLDDSQDLDELHLIFLEWFFTNCVFQPKSATEYCAKLPHKTVINEPPISV